MAYDPESRWSIKFKIIKFMLYYVKTNLISNIKSNWNSTFRKFVTSAWPKLYQFWRFERSGIWIYLLIIVKYIQYFNIFKANILMFIQNLIDSSIILQGKLTSHLYLTIFNSKSPKNPQITFLLLFDYFWFLSKCCLKTLETLILRFLYNFNGFVGKFLLRRRLDV